LTNENVPGSTGGGSEETLGLIRNRIAKLSESLIYLANQTPQDPFSAFDLANFDEFELQKTLLSTMLDRCSDPSRSGINDLIRLSAFIKQRKNFKGSRRIELRYPGPNPLSSVFCDIPEEE
jgi:hypothetical protein